MSILSKIFGDANERYIKSLLPIVEHINGLENEFRGLSDEQLKNKTGQFHQRLERGEALDDLLPEAFAAAREASRRTLGQRHYDVQLIGGIVLHQGKLAEMRTGEGKTLVATLPVYLNALERRGVHVVTVNDFLARRDATWMGQIYNALGLTVGCINHEASYIYDEKHRHDENSKPEIPKLKPTQNSDDQNSKQDTHDIQRDVVGGFRVIHEYMRPVTRREAYQADITYGTNNEYGFDYLRDNMVYDTAQMAQRSESTHNFAIVDEVDSILIDEARTPLIISAPDAESTKLYDTFAKVAPHLTAGDDYTVDEKLKATSITESGIAKVEKRLGIDNIYAEGGVRYAHHLEQALRAEVLFKRDRDYVVKDGEVIIVDEFTGRLMPGRRWSDGLHQAVEAKEGVSIQKESRTLATITFQNYFRLYKKLAGMTGTARTSAEEFHKVYKLDVVTTPTNRPMVRVNLPDRIYKTELGKFRAVAREIRERNEKGQPVLVGTVSIEKNELLASLLEREGIKHNILNAKNHEREAEFTAQAGRLGAVTIATNMAGRGVDIILGGNPPDSQEAEQVRQTGGLHVIGTERHEARRIDDQLRGRAGRQGDPGSSQFYVSTEDDLARVFGGDRMKSIMERLGLGDDEVVENKFISGAIQQAQMRIEGFHFDSRKYVLEYDDVMNKHRGAIYALRGQALRSDNSRETVLGFLKEHIKQIVNFHVQNETGEPDTKSMADVLRAMAPFDVNLKDKLDDIIRTAHGSTTFIEYLDVELERLYAAKEAQIGASMRQLEKIVLLRTIDEIWMDHIDAMEYLRDSVRLRAYGQRDPLVEYKIEGQKMFEQLLGAIRAQVANVIFKVSFMPQPSLDSDIVEGRGSAMPLASEGQSNKMRGQEERPNIAGITNDNKQLTNNNKIGRNDPCLCGATHPDGHPKKYKHCHGK